MFAVWFLEVAVYAGLVMIGAAVIAFLVLLYRDSRSKTLW